MTSDHSPYHQRHSLRLKGYDYTQPGAYFVTLCVQHRLLLLEPTPVREMIERWWAKLPEKYPCVELDAFVASECLKLIEGEQSPEVALEREGRIGPSPG